jgi:signal transduction histidine kinase
MQLNKTDLSFYAMAKRLATRYQTQTDKHEILVDIPETFPVVMADEVRMEQVLTNLLSNAIKYSPGGEIHITGSNLSDQVIVCVADEGPGISPGDLPYIFDRFYRAPETSRKTKGAGLGLYLARAIIEAHGGRMWADPKATAGARICFSLPKD